VSDIDSVKRPNGSAKLPGPPGKTSTRAKPKRRSWSASSDGSARRMGYPPSSTRFSRPIATETSSPCLCRSDNAGAPSGVTSGPMVDGAAFMLPHLALC